MKRICSVCKQTKPLTEFYKDKSRTLGRTYRCAKCDDLRHNEYLASAKGKAKRKQYLQSDGAQQLRRARQRRDYWVNRHKYTAKKMVAVMIETGDITRQPCEKCGEEKAVAHHSDYAKPLEIVWLCHACHMAEHKRIRTQSS